MPTYVVLYKFTSQGRKKFKGTVARAQEVKKQNEARGFKVVGTWWTQGRFDVVSVLEAPSETAMIAGLVNIAETGNVTSETLRAFGEEEMQTILKEAVKRPSKGRGK